jgi:hypothetical protein
MKQAFSSFSKVEIHISNPPYSLADINAGPISYFRLCKFSIEPDIVHASSGALPVPSCDLDKQGKNSALSILHPATRHDHKASMM